MKVGRAMVVDRVTEQRLLISDVCSSNPAISVILYGLLTDVKTKLKKKRQGMAHFKMR